MESDKTPKALRICLTTFRICISVAPDFRMATMLGICVAYAARLSRR